MNWFSHAEVPLVACLEPLEITQSVPLAFPFRSLLVFPIFLTRFGATGSCFS